MITAPSCALATGLSLACPVVGVDGAAADFAAWAGRDVTVLRYTGCVVTESEIERARAAGVRVEVIDTAVDVGSNGSR